jgi:hypothetical protein
MKVNTKYKVVTYKFEIPVSVLEGKSEESEKVEAYYAARDRFYNYSINEAEISIVDVDKEEYDRRVEIDHKLHNINK